MFTQASGYVGIDIRPGPGVDYTIDAHTLDPESFEGFLDGFNVVITTETLEHDPAPQSLIDISWQMLHPGGWLVLTAASTGRPPHSVNGDQNFQPNEHYANIDPHQLKMWLQDWQNVLIEFNPNPGDVYATARKPYGPK